MNSNNSNYRTGVFWSFLSAFLWGTTFVSARFLMENRQIDPFSLSLVRFAFGGAILFILGTIFFRNKIFSVTLKDLFKLTLLSLFGIVAMSVFLFTGQESTTAINTSLIMALAPVLILFIGIFIGEKLTLNKSLGIVISLLGCALVVNVITENGFYYNPDYIKGDLLVFCSALCWSIYSVFSVPIVKRIGGFAATTWAMLLGAFILFLIRLFLKQDYYLPQTPFSWSIVVYLTIFPTAIAFFAWYEAMGKIELSLLNVMQYLSPVFTIIFAMILLGERMNLLNIAGVLLVIAGVAFTTEKLAYVMKSKFTALKITVLHYFQLICSRIYRNCS